MKASQLGKHAPDPFLILYIPATHKTPSTKQQFATMVSSKGKPTDPKLREEAKEGT